MISPKLKAYYDKYGIPYDINTNFKSFCLYMIPKIDGSDWQWFHFYIMDRCDYYLRQSINPDINKMHQLMLEMPQRHGKSLIIGTLLPAYYLALAPDKWVLYTTHTADLAIDQSKQLIKLMTSDKYKWVYPHVPLKYELDNDENTQQTKEQRKYNKLTDNSLTIVGRNGGYNSVSVGQNINGLKAHLLICDDYFASYNQAQSETERNKRWKWYQGDARGRRESGCFEIDTSSRQHQDDIIGKNIEYSRDRLLKEEELYHENQNFKRVFKGIERIVFRAKAIQDHEFPYDNRKKDDYLWSKFIDKYLDAEYGDPIVWSTTYQSMPFNITTQFLQLEQLKEYNHRLKPTNVFISVDTNQNADALKGDCAGITVWSYTGKDKYLLEFVNERLSFVNLVATIERLIAKYPFYIGILIEGASSGYAVHNVLSQKFSKVIILPVSKNKMERFQMCLPEFHAGNIFLPSPSICPGIYIYKQQLLNFTGVKGGVDDLVDSTTQFLNYINQHIIILDKSHLDVVQYKTFGKPINTNGMRNYGISRNGEIA